MKTHKYALFLLTLVLFFAGLVLFPIQAAHAQTSVRYVAPTAIGAGDCTSWADACTLQYALTGAVAGQDIWVMQGVHKPTTDTTDRFARFTIKSSVGLYGGFAGHETTRDQRDPEINITILSGDIDNNDTNTDGNFIAETYTDIQGANSYHLLHAYRVNSSAVVDGFVITAGYADDLNTDGNFIGAGLFNESNAVYGDPGDGSHPALNNLIFSGNWAESAGGGIYNDFYSNPTLTNVTFTGNRSEGGRGGGMYNHLGNPILTNVAFNGNSAGSHGGGLAFQGEDAGRNHMLLTDVSFIGNVAHFSGGGLHLDDRAGATLTNVTFANNSARDGGGIYNWASRMTLTNVTFSHNSASVCGGGMCISNWYPATTPAPPLTNVTFVGNTASYGSGLSFSSLEINLHNTIFWGNTSTSGEGPIRVGLRGSLYIYNSVIQDGCPVGIACTNVTGADPLLGALGNYGGRVPTIPLLPGSSAINLSSSNCPATDARGLARANPCDAGAFESQGFNLMITGGSPQGTFPNSPFAQPLQVSVTANNPSEPVDGGQVAYTAPASGPTATITGNPATISDGSASVSATANGTLGAYQVTASAVGANTVNFDLRNSAPWHAAPEAVGSGDCSNWANACTLQTALANATAGEEVWVLRGVHKPTTDTTDRTASFNLKSGVGVYGGFAGYETARDQRSTGANTTILSGDIDNNDSNGIQGNNSYHVVTTNGVSGTVLDGFTITAGQANDAASYEDLGGGMINWGGSPTLANLTFSGNYAIGGGGMFNWAGSPTLANVVFRSNTASDNGGGMFNADGGHPDLTNVTFSGNAANYGGGISNSSGATITLNHVTLSGNLANNGGGMFNWGSDLVIHNSIFWDNSASFGSQVSNENGYLTFSDSAIQGGCPGGSSCTNLITADPLLGTIGNYGGAVQTIPLLPGSSAINAASGNCPATDARGVARSTPCDIGAFESQGFFLSITSGNYQGALVNTAFGQWLQVRVSPNAAGEPVAGGQVIFTAPGSGASAALTDSPATINSSGIASVSAVANGTLGSYQVSANTVDAYAVNFSLQNVVSLRRYAAPTAAGSGDCSSWADACTLQTALSVAAWSSDIWVQAGLHKPTPNTTDRSASFVLTSMRVYGGFAGNETALDQRNSSVNVTVLSGDIDNNDTNADGNFIAETSTDIQGSNAYHVVKVHGGSGAQNVLDGFTITAGQANSGTSPDNEGGGIYSDSALALTNMTFSGNTANQGGGLYANNSHAQLTNITFSGNAAEIGGGVANWYSQPTLTHVTFSGNTASTGGGGMSNHDSSPRIYNTIFWGNTAPTGAQIYNLGTNTNPQISDSVVQGGYAGGTNIITADPRLGALGDYSGATQVIPLLPGSSALEAAYDNYCPATDQRGAFRFEYCDIGAFESQGFSMNIIGGNNQDGLLNNAFPLPLQVSVTANNPGEPVDGGQVIFTAPASGASASFDLNPAAITGGTASVNITANDTSGTYQINARVSEFMVVDFDLRNYFSGYAAPAAVGAGDCSSWADACTLQTALAGSVTGDEIWVQAGVHKPTTGTDRTLAFNLVDGVTVYGGFAGTETALIQRDPAVNVTILSGDIDNNDTNTDGNFIAETTADIQGDNSYHVVIASGLGSNTVLDGFTITAGQANGIGTSSRGGGLYNDTSSPSLINMAFSGNSASNDGGGMYITNSTTPALINVVFSGNSASDDGGGMYNNSNPALTNVTFRNNQASARGGGMFSEGNPSLMQVTFNRNSAGQGGGIYNGGANPELNEVLFSGNLASFGGGGMYNAGGYAYLTNVAFSGNSANYGGAMHNWSGYSSMINVTFTGNSASGCGGGMYNNNVFNNPIISNAIFWGNTAPTGAQICTLPNTSSTYTRRFANSVLQGSGGSLAWDPSYGTDEGGNLDIDPLFVRNPNDGGDGWGNTNDDYGDLRLQGSSAAIDAADNGTCPAIDQRGEPRADWACDIGAYETLLSDSDTVNKVISGAATYTFGPTLAKVVVIDDGGCLTGLNIQRENSNHPQATAPNLQTGVHWTLTPVGCNSGFNVSITLPTPNFTPDGNSKLCRWDTANSAWDCGESGDHLPGNAMMADDSIINVVTRQNVTAFSQWTVGNNTGPTAVSLAGFTAHTETSLLNLGVVVSLLAGVSLFVVSKKQKA